jgi:hypothetical protein
LRNAAAVLRALSRAAAAVLIALPPFARAQKVRLEVHPHAGDTLRVLFEHTAILSAAPRTGYAAVPPSTTTATLVAREIVERSTARSSEILAIIDSVAVTRSGSEAPAIFQRIDRSLHGTRVRVKVASDGGCRVADGFSLDPGLRALIGETPALLPAHEVAIGDSWRRDLPVPGDGGSASPREPVHATFHLDSLTESGSVAWVSFTGALPRSAQPDTVQPRQSESTGELTGTVVLDRRRGWILESRASVIMESVVAMPGGGEPLVVRVRVSQTMKLRK